MFSVRSLLNVRGLVRSVQSLSSVGVPGVHFVRCFYQSCVMSAKSGRKLLDDQDEMEYNITFPTAAGLDEADVKEPVVYLLGWAGAIDKHLARYSAIYEQEGCVTLRYILPDEVVFLLTKETIKTVEDNSQKLVQLLDDYDLRENPILIHCFSNGGSMLYRWFAEALLKEKINVVGVIIDSAPSRVTVSSAMLAIYYSQRHKGFFYWLNYVCRFFAVNLTSVFSWDERLNFYDYLLQSKSYLWPHLFLSSSNDGIIPMSDVMEMVKSRKNAGCAFVRHHDFVTSPHVQHLKFHGEEYVNRCLQFLEDCLKIFDGEDVDGIVDTNKQQISSVDPPVMNSRPHSEGSPSTSGRKSSLRLRKTSQSETKI